MLDILLFNSSFSRVKLIFSKLLQALSFSNFTNRLILESFFIFDNSISFLSIIFLYSNNFVLKQDIKCFVFNVSCSSFDKI